MLYNYIGSNDFRQGLFAYLDQYRHQNATSLDFFRVMEQVSGKPVVSVFNSWVKNPGYPLIRVSSKQEGNYRTFTVTQEKFCDNHAGSNDKDKEKRGSVGNKDSKDGLWMIPVTFASATRENLHSAVLEKRTTTVTFLIGKAHWVTINPGHFGFFRVRYSQDCFAQLLSAVRQKMLPIFERMSLLSDLNAMTLNGISSTVELLSVLEAYVEETHYSVWKVIVSVITRLDLLLDSTDYYKKFQAFVYFIFSRIAEKTNFEVKTDEEHLLALRRNLILSTMVRFRKQNVLTEARNLFEKSQADGVGIAHDIRDPVYKAVLQDCDEDVIRTFFQMYRDAGLQGSLEEQGRICKSLGSVSDGEKVKLVLEFAIKEDVRDQHAVAILQSLAGNSSPEGREMAWNFFKEHWSLFRQRFLGSDLIPRLVKGLIENFSTEEKAMEITDFFRDHHVAGTDRIILLNCEKIRAQEAVFKKDTNFIQDHLSSYA
jgi:puromycin-sensitive aminopeptidase